MSLSIILIRLGTICHHKTGYVLKLAVERAERIGCLCNSGIKNK